MVWEGCVFALYLKRQWVGRIGRNCGCGRAEPSVGQDLLGRIVQDLRRRCSTESDLWQRYLLSTQDNNLSVQCRGLEQELLLTQATRQFNNFLFSNTIPVVQKNSRQNETRVYPEWIFWVKIHSYFNLLLLEKGCWCFPSNSYRSTGRTPDPRHPEVHNIQLWLPLLIHPAPNTKSFTICCTLLPVELSDALKSFFLCFPTQIYLDLPFQTSWFSFTAHSHLGNGIPCWLSSITLYVLTSFLLQKILLSWLYWHVF